MRAISAPFLLQLLEPRHDQIVSVRHQIAEGEVVELAAHPLHAHSAGERGVDVERVLGDARALVLRHEGERAHVVQPVGELDQQHARVVGDGEQQLAEILRLLGVLGGEVEPVELGQALDQSADLRAEDLVDLLARGGGVLDRVVQNRGDDGRVVELEIGENRRHFKRMRKERVAGRALLRPMRLHGEDVSAVKQVFVGVGIVTANAFDQFILPHHCSVRASRGSERVGSGTARDRPPPRTIQRETPRASLSSTWLERPQTFSATTRRHLPRLFDWQAVTLGCCYLDFPLSLPP